MANRGSLLVAPLGTIDYLAALALQEAALRARQFDTLGDLLLMLEHPHVFTLGRGASESFLVNPRDGVPVHRVSRGGEVTYHGPGQLVGYPILKLEGTERDVHRYLRKLERSMIDALSKVGLAAGRRNGLTGVWIGPRKIASIGVGIRRWVTLHGFALNVSPDLGFFDAIVPCGIDGCRMTSIAAEGRADVSVADFMPAMIARFAEVFGYETIRQVDGAELAGLVDRRDEACEARM